MPRIRADAGWCLPLIQELARTSRRSAETLMAPGELRPRQILALMTLSERGALSQQVLGKTLGLDPSNVVGLLNELEDRGLTTRRRDPADRRRHIVELSTDGEAELEAAEVRISQVEDEVLQALSARERAELYQLLLRAVGEDQAPYEPPPE